jgi:hypothetical protein
VNTAANENKGLSTTPPTPLLHEDNYILANTLPLEDGINRAILRSLTSAGKIELHAEADGLKPAEVELVSLAVALQDGLSTYMPTAELASNLKRGPTPPGPSFLQSRFPIALGSVTAGSNQASVGQSQDDDESISWSSDGTLGNAWVEYVFAAPQIPDQIDLKLGGFRQLHFALRVTLDGKAVWEGTTPTSLGYITLNLKPALGTHLRIALTGSPVRGNEFGQIRELAGATAAQAEQPSKPILTVIEAEIYRATP